MLKLQHQDKWLDRSPETHADLLKAPLLMAHGSNDHRVPTEESRILVAKFQSLNKPVSYLEISGQGHGFKGTSALSKYYTGVFEFLSDFKCNECSKKD